MKNGKDKNANTHIMGAIDGLESDLEMARAECERLASLIGDLRSLGGLGEKATKVTKKKKAAKKDKGGRIRGRRNGQTCEEIVSLLWAHGSAHVRVIADHFGLTAPRARARLTVARKSGYVRFAGKPRQQDGEWVLTAKGVRFAKKTLAETADQVAAT